MRDGHEIDRLAARPCLQKGKLRSKHSTAAAQGHAGFDRAVAGDGAGMDRCYLSHYLHHKYFQVNYSDGMAPLNKWFGSFHDGTPEAHEAIKARRLRRGV
jgi:sterol desaturase/sphingolipid hydroxylase (fatty acid hydroxylase superfamily)